MMTDYIAGQRKFRGFITGHGVKLVKVTDNGLQVDESGWEHFAWTLTVVNNYDRSQVCYEFPFKQGTAHTAKPTIVDLFGSLFLDASTVAGQSFEEWADDLGYDTDSRQAERMYQEIRSNTAKLCKLFRTTAIGPLIDRARPLMEEAGI